MGACAYTLIEELKDRIKGDVIEIGSERGEGSTLFLFDFCKRNGFDFYTVDFEKEAFNRAKAVCGNRANYMTGEKFLNNFYPKEKVISFAYLDNFDFIYDEIKGQLRVKNQIREYAKYNIVMNNENSKIAHLTQTKMILRHTDGFCAILLDDTFLNSEGEIDGKGGFAVPYLLNKGWKIYMDNHGMNLAPWQQYILLYNDK